MLFDVHHGFLMLGVSAVIRALFRNRSPSDMSPLDVGRRSLALPGEAFGLQPLEIGPESRIGLFSISQGLLGSKAILFPLEVSFLFGDGRF
jgi:hypothetical protein